MAAPAASRSRGPRGAARRRAILEGALACYAERGWEATGVADLCRASGASVGSLYHHFGSKEALAGALYVEALRDYQESLLAALGRPRSAAGLVKGVVRHHLDWVLARPDAARFLLEMRRAEGVASAEPSIRALTRRFFEALGPAFARFERAGSLRPVAPEARGALLIGPGQEIARHWLRAGLPGPRERRRVRETLAEAAWRALRGEGEAEARPRGGARAAPRRATGPRRRP